MSNMFNYENTENLYKTALDWPHITDPSLQDYALKFIFGEIDLARRKLSSNRSKRQPIEAENRRIFMLKSLASTIAKLPICEDDYNAKAHSEMYP